MEIATIKYGNRAKLGAANKLDERKSFRGSTMQRQNFSISGRNATFIDQPALCVGFPFSSFVSFPTFRVSQYLLTRCDFSICVIQNQRAIHTGPVFLSRRPYFALSLFCAPDTF